jgi:hypothetical protein
MRINEKKLIAEAKKLLDDEMHKAKRHHSSPAHFPKE